MARTVNTSKIDTHCPVCARQMFPVGGLEYIRRYGQTYATQMIECAEGCAQRRIWWSATIAKYLWPHLATEANADGHGDE